MKMSPKELPTDAEKLRCEIKDMIPELSGRRTQDSATVIRNARGNLCYGGDSLGKKVKSLTLMLSISNFSVCFPVFFFFFLMDEVGLPNRIGVGLWYILITKRPWS